MNTDKIYTYMLEKNVYSLRAKELIELGFSYYEITKLMEEKVIKKTSRGIYDLDDFDSIVSYTKALLKKDPVKAIFYQEQLLKIRPNDEFLNLNLFKYYLANKDIKQAFRIYDNLYKEKMIGKEDTNLLLVLFSRMITLSEEDALAVSYINEDDITFENLRLDKQVKMNNCYRLSIFYNNFVEASSIAKENKINNPLLYSMAKLLTKMHDDQEEKSFELIKQKKYEEAYSYFQNDYTLADKKSFHYIFSLFLLSKLLGKNFDFDEKIIDSKYGDIVQMIKNEDWNAFLPFWQKKKEQAKKKKVKEHIEIILDLLDEVLNKEKTEEKVLVKEEKIQQESKKEEVVVSNSSTTSQSIVNFSTVVSSLIDEDFINVKSIIKQYLKGLNKEEYLEIVTNEIKLNLLDKDALYSTSMFLLTSLENGMYTFNSNECLQKYYQALEEKNIVKAKIYLSSICSANAAGLSNFNVDRFLEMTNALTENQVEASVLDKINQLDGKKKILTKEKVVKKNRTFQDENVKEEEKNKVQEASMVQNTKDSKNKEESIETQAERKMLTKEKKAIKEKRKNQVQEEPVVQTTAVEVVVQDTEEKGLEERDTETKNSIIKIAPNELRKILYDLFLERGTLEKKDLEELANKDQILDSNLLKLKNDKYYLKDIESFYKYGEELKDTRDFERAGKCFAICYRERPKSHKYFFSYFRSIIEGGTSEEVLSMLQIASEKRQISPINRNTLLYLMSLTSELPDSLQQEVEGFQLKDLTCKIEDEERQKAKEDIFVRHNLYSARMLYSKSNLKTKRQEKDKLIFSMLNRVIRKYKSEVNPMIEFAMEKGKLTKKFLNTLGISDERIEVLVKQKYLKRVRRYEYDFIDAFSIYGCSKCQPIEKQEKYLETCYNLKKNSHYLILYLKRLLSNKKYSKMVTLIEEGKNKNIIDENYYAEWIVLLSELEPTAKKKKEQIIKEGLNIETKEILKKISEGNLEEASQLNSTAFSPFQGMTSNLIKECSLNQKENDFVSNIIDGIKEKNEGKTQFAISMYLKQINKPEYKYLILNLIQVSKEDVSSIEQEMKDMAKEDYVFSFEKYLPGFYESMEKEDYETIDVYYKIIQKYSEYKDDKEFLKQLRGSLFNMTKYKDNHFGLENIDSIANTITEMNMDVLSACKKLGLDSEKTNLVLLFCARDAFAEDNMRLGNKFLSLVEKSQDKTNNVKALYKNVVKRKKIYSKNLSEDEKRLILRPRVTTYTAK